MTESEAYEAQEVLMERLAQLTEMEKALMPSKMEITLRCAIEDFERRYEGTNPFCVLMYRDTDDEQWQIFHPRDLGTPLFSIDKDGVGYEHT